MLSLDSLLDATHIKCVFMPSASINHSNEEECSRPVTPAEEQRGLFAG